MNQATQRSQPVELSIVIPVFNEEENLPILIRKVAEVAKGLGLVYEMIFVDDASSDGSRRVIKEMLDQYPYLRMIGFRKNCGLSAALLAGIREAQGKWIVTMDSDLQTDPADIPKLLKYLDHYEMATGWRQKREDPWLKRISSRVANAVRNRLSGETIKDSANTFRAFKKECVKNLPVFSGMHRFLPTLVKMEGYRVIEIPVSHYPRKFGTSKFNIRNRMVTVFIDLLGVKWMKSRRIEYEIEERI